MTVVSIFITLAILAIIITIIILEYKEECRVSEKYRQFDMKKINEIYQCEDDGLCNSCKYGIDRCLSDGEPYCKKKEDENAGKKRSV